MPRRAATPRTLVPRARHAPADAPAAAAARRGARPLGAHRAAAERARSTRPIAGARSPSCCSSATACSSAPPSSPRASRAGLPGLRRALGELETLGVSRRGYLVDGLGGAQHALPGAIERLREVRDPAPDAPAIALAASDPANPYGVALRWPARAAGRASRAAGATVVLRNGEPLAFLERGARTLLSLQPLELAGWAAVAQALATASLEGRVGSLQLERIDGEPAAGSPVGAAFTDAGFVAGPKRLTLRARR